MKLNIANFKKYIFPAHFSLKFSRGLNNYFKEKNLQI